MSQGQWKALGLEMQSLHLWYSGRLSILRDEGCCTSGNQRGYNLDIEHELCLNGTMFRLKQRGLEDERKETSRLFQQRELHEAESVYLENIVEICFCLV